MGATHLTAIEAFWFNSEVRVATVDHINEQQESTGTGTGQAGRSYPEEAEQDMIENARTRSKQASAMKQAGKRAPTPESQLEALDDLEHEQGEFNRSPKDVIEVE